MGVKSVEISRLHLPLLCQTSGSSHTLTMQLCIRRLACLAVLVGILASQTTLSIPVKVTNCCTKVSTMNITAQIIGYRIQKRNLPCVRAVIFETTEGEVCSHWREEWVFEKIRQLEFYRRAKKTAPATTTPSS